jgi:hypothetical protein
MLALLPILLSASAAFAGGFGVLGTGGAHGDRVYYYAENSVGDTEQQPPLDEMNPNFGGGLELVLGDKDYKINGFFRMYYLADWPVTVPDNASAYTFNLRTDSVRDIGMAEAGLQFGVWGDPEAFQLCVIGIIGSGLLTVDQTEFMTAEAGFGFTYTFMRNIQLHGEVDGGIRYRKRIFPTANATAGVRYLFD